MVQPVNQFTRSVAIVAFVAASLGLTTPAQARPETLRWTHPRSDALDFEVRITSSQIRRPRSSPSASRASPSGRRRRAGRGRRRNVELELRAIGPGGERSTWTSAQLRTGPVAPRPLSRNRNRNPSRSPSPSPSPSRNRRAECPPAEEPGFLRRPAAARFDFENIAPGIRVAGWVDTTRHHRLDVDDSLFSVVEVDGNCVLTDSTAIAIQSTATADVRNNFEVRGRMAMSHPEAEIGVTTYSRFPTESVHYRIAANAGETFQFVGRPTVVCASSDSGVRPTAGEWIRFELDVRDEGGQNRIVAKLWPADSAEPAAPQIDCIDSSASRPTEGSVGAWSGGPGLKYWDDFEIFQGITGGGSSSTAPLPPLLIQIVPFEDN